MHAIVLFAIGSPIVAEYEETCKRLGVSIVGAVRNHPGPAFAGPAVSVVAVADLGPAQLETPCIVPLFTPRNRAHAASEAAALGFVFADALIDPTAVLASSVTAGRGAFVNAGCIVGAHAVFGAHVLANRGALVGHHVWIDDFASLGPGAVIGGNVTIGRGAMIGAGAVLLPSVRVGADAIVGAGSIVVGDVPAGAKVMGNPARPVASAAART